MATLHIPDKKTTLGAFEPVRDFLAERGILLDRWEASESFAPDADQETVLRAYAPVLKPYMEANGYQTADVIVVNPETPNLRQIRDKFLQEHTHSEDEVRFFVEGRGYFWFHLENPEEVFCVTCEAGDLLCVPAGFKHWFDLGEPAHVKAIRIFIDPAGWVPDYTGSGIDARYRDVMSALR
jgi:1,2-dihydroxy-3-keto-5-methylthiopentene dioxygenase